MPTRSAGLLKKVSEESEYLSREFLRRPTEVSAQKLRDSATQKLVITIDGPAGVGKSTVAKLLAKRLGLRYVDTGATYRALAHQALADEAGPLGAAPPVAAL